MVEISSKAFDGIESCELMSIEITGISLKE